MKDQYRELEMWFGNYVLQFHSDEQAYQRNIEVKREHSYRVKDNMADLSHFLGFSEQQTCIAKVIGLLHDIGRFEQFKRYHTFYDKVSVDHADLGVAVLKELNVLNPWSDAAQNLILKAISWHNKKALPEDLSENETQYCKLIRDADKLDIWRVVTDYYCQMDKETNNTLQLDLPDTPGYQQVNVAHIRDHKIVDLSDLKNLNDFKLLQVGWVFDLNYTASLALLEQRDYLTPLFDSLPNDQTIEALKQDVTQYVRSAVKNRA